MLHKYKRIELFLVSLFFCHLQSGNKRPRVNKINLQLKPHHPSDPSPLKEPCWSCLRNIQRSLTIIGDTYRLQHFIVGCQWQPNKLAAIVVQRYLRMAITSLHLLYNTDWHLEEKITEVSFILCVYSLVIWNVSDGIQSLFLSANYQHPQHVTLGKGVDLGQITSVPARQRPC